MDNLLSKQEIINNIEKEDCDKKIKEIVKCYIDNGLVEGRLDEKGRLRLSKEEYENW